MPPEPDHLTLVIDHPIGVSLCVRSRFSPARCRVLSRLLSSSPSRPLAGRLGKVGHGLAPRCDNCDPVPGLGPRRGVRQAVGEGRFDRGAVFADAVVERGTELAEDRRGAGLKAPSAKGRSERHRRNVLSAADAFGIS